MTTATRPAMATKTRQREVILKPARYEPVRNGDVIESVFMPIEKTYKDEEYQVWLVETSFEGLTETHEFLNEQDALSFFRGVK